jgi:hypothetical protein
VNRRTAALLASYSERSRGGRRHGPLARVAWHVVRGAAERGDQNAIQAIWQAWLRCPDDERWEVLSRCRNPADPAEAVLAAAVDPARTPAERAALGAFCARRGMLPADGIQRVLFSGDLDLVRVVARDRPTAVTSEERAYLADQLASRGEWERLWRLVLDFPLAETVRAMRRFPRGWRPVDEAGRRLFTVLARTSPETVAVVGTAAAARVSLGRETLASCSFAPDGSQVAITAHRPLRSRHSLSEPVTTLHALPGGRELERLPGVAVGLFHGTHLGESLVCLDGRRNYRVVVRYSPRSGSEDIHSFDRVEGILRLHKVSGGFVVGTRTRLLHGTAAPQSPLREVTPRALRQELAEKQITMLASEPMTGRLAVVIREEPHHYESLAVLDADFRVIGRGADIADRLDRSCFEWLGFCGPDRLITRSAFKQLCSWRVEPRLIREATTRSSARHMLPMPAAGWIVLDSRDHRDARTLQEVDYPPMLGWMLHAGAGRLLSTDTDHHVAWLRDDGDLEVRDLRLGEISELVERPMASSCLADLNVVAEASAYATSPEIAEVTRLMRACLEYRFGADIGLGTTTGSPGGADDIALTADGEPGR